MTDSDEYEILCSNLVEIVKEMRDYDEKWVKVGRSYGEMDRSHEKNDCSCER